MLSNQVHKKLADGTFGLEEGEEAGDGLKTSGSRAMDAYRMKQTGATATFDPTRGGAKASDEVAKVLADSKKQACRPNSRYTLLQMPFTYPVEPLYPRRTGQHGKLCQ